MTMINWNEPASVEGGIFEKIEVSAPVTVTSSIEANEIMIHETGTLTVQGKVNAPFIRVSGTLNIEDTLETEQLTIDKDAELRVNRDTISASIHNKGRLQTEGGLRSEKFDSTGVVVARGPINSERFRSTGSLQLDNDLTVQAAEIIVSEVSNIRYLNGEEVQVKAEREMLLFKDEDSRLSVREIDGSVLTLENVIAELVRGDNVTIKNNCTIKTVEYTESYNYDESSDVHEFAKIKR
ncbi:hypothetical protein [Macrococcoides caseolyticum]|uniref:Polymer-forming cytoskeletal protein n=2 Tax=Macrococcoides caseolyticum TaxID=69966 RepID=A0A855H2Z8_9STAP|nr:hypothetical protein [Macrococcus caseolyticus]PKD99610.1 hypothetical protein CW719_03065 [Macrococcus caseolyticus]PKE17252.1 hypothetical protein CW718_05055 [Macrococcus caseolyticus]PKE21126.1 hypothetical protein CW688_08610 [Macrococcus caseolyticus]PKE26067.1 hypothetical protein CW686_06860 [Macrococcus caseolyticus]PKE36548.1 hypothetical protein CW695_02600 [Macrococcus caseolyticus]